MGRSPLGDRPRDDPLAGFRPHQLVSHGRAMPLSVCCRLNSAFSICILSQSGRVILWIADSCGSILARNRSAAAARHSPTQQASRPPAPCGIEPKPPIDDPAVCTSTYRVA